MTLITQQVSSPTPLPDPPNPAVDEEQEFDDKAYPYTVAQNAFGLKIQEISGEINIVGDQINVLALEINDNATNATNSATTAQTAATTATNAAANASVDATRAENAVEIIAAVTGLNITGAHLDANGFGHIFCDVTGIYSDPRVNADGNLIITKTT